MLAVPQKSFKLSFSPPKDIRKPLKKKFRKSIENTFITFFLTVANLKGFLGVIVLII